MGNLIELQNSVIEAHKREQARDAGLSMLIDTLAEYIAEAEQNPEYCGMVIDEQRDAGGQLLAIRLVLCDIVGGDVARRVA